MSEPEQNWYPIGEVGWFTGNVRKGAEVTPGSWTCSGVPGRAVPAR